MTPDFFVEDENLNLTPEQLKIMREQLGQPGQWLTIYGNYAGQNLEYQVGTDYLKDFDYIALYALGNKVFARVPTSARRLESAQGEAAEQADYTSTKVAAVYLRGPAGFEAELPPHAVAKLPEGYVVLDFFSALELRDFMLA